MIEITPSFLMRVLRIPLARAQERVEPLKKAIEYAELDTPLRLAHYLGQVGQETGRFLYKREIWGPSAAQLRYERNFNAPWPSSPEESRLKAFVVNRLAYALGNVNAGDGLRYLGRGDLQTTGRGNYQRLTRRMRTKLNDCPDFEATPILLQQFPWVALSGADYWVMRDINRFADDDDIYRVTRAVNGGTTHIDQRQAIKTLALSVILEIEHELL